MGKEKGPALDVIVTAATISGLSLVSEAVRQQPDAIPVAISTAPAVVAGLLGKRYFAYSLLIGSAGWAVTNSFLLYLLSTPIAGTFLGAALTKRLPKEKPDEPIEFH
ncbi:hypothetical protein K2X83_00280 [Patescibacteria group bacterium]|nr:hypothetical protein [Patescibacteria group bacterium]